MLGQVEAAYLAGRRARQRMDQVVALGALRRCEVLDRVRVQHLLGARADHCGAHPLPPALVLDADAIVFATEKPADIGKLEEVPTFGKLGAVKENRAVYTDGTLAGALYFMTPLSLDYALKKLTPQLADAVAGKAPRRMLESAR